MTLTEPKTEFFFLYVRKFTPHDVGNREKIAIVYKKDPALTVSGKNTLSIINY